MESVDGHSTLTCPCKTEDIENSSQFSSDNICTQYLLQQTSLIDSQVKNLPANAGDENSVPGSGRSPRERNGNWLQFSCLGNPMERAAWRATVHRVKNGKDLATKQPQFTTALYLAKQYLSNLSMEKDFRQITEILALGDIGYDV